MSLSTQQFNISRLIDIKSNKPKNNYAKKGVLFTTPSVQTPSKPIDLYNQGCPQKTWNIAPTTLKRNDFKVFSTGDAFSILSPDVEVNGANFNIHVGIEHANYSPLVLLQEALQLCRCVYEHGAAEVTIALPEQFHPILHANDFNMLLMRLFKASGANKIYFYDKNYTGTLDEKNSKAIMPLTLSQKSDIEHYKISKNALLEYLHSSDDQKLNLDAKVMQVMRKNDLNRAWSKFDASHTNMIETLSSKADPSEIKIPEIKAQPHVLLCCSANKPLAEKIAASLRMKGEMVKLYQVDGKSEKATIPNAAEICGAIVTIVQSTRPNPDNIEETKDYEINGASSYFFEAAMIARQAHLRGAEKINLINPYQNSARSDKAEDNPKGKTGSYVQHNGQLLAAAGVNHVITAECHDAHTLSGSYTGKNIQGSAVSALTIMSMSLVTDWINNPAHSMHGQLRLVTPDAGATKRTNELTLKLQTILGKKLSESRILGEKHRDSHQDDSALINNLNSGTIGINANDKYLITDDETATGNTLCQAITNLTKNGAKDISVIVVHNNMPLDWLLRQLCLARFLYLGVNDLHFSDTQEMGTLAKSYDDLIQTYTQKSHLSVNEIEKQVLAWFKKNISEYFSNKTAEHLNQEFNRFKSMLTQFQSRIAIHSLANEFANQVSVKHSMEKSPENNCHDETGLLPQGAYAADKGSLLFFQNQPGNLQKTSASSENGHAAVFALGRKN